MNNLNNSTFFLTFHIQDQDTLWLRMGHIYTVTKWVKSSWAYSVLSVIKNS